MRVEPSDVDIAEASLAREVGPDVVADEDALLRIQSARRHDDRGAVEGACAELQAWVARRKIVSRPRRRSGQ